jgi:urea transport system substrate-binding protein
LLQDSECLLELHSLDKNAATAYSMAMILLHSSTSTKGELSMAGILTRRELLKTAGKAGLSLAAAQTMSPFAFSVDRAKDIPTIKVGILHSLSGFVASLEAPLRDAELMAIDEINQKGGVLAKRIEAVIEDPQSNFSKGFPEKAQKLLSEDKVAAVFGCWTSASRKSVLPVFEQNNGLLFYPAAYEGCENSKNVIYTGSTPNQLALAAVDWLLSKEGGEKRKFYLLGSDYIYPRVANLLISKYLRTKGLAPVAEKYTPLGHRDYQAVVADIKANKPDVILSTLNSLGGGESSFFNELAAAGITANTVPVCSLLAEEECLSGLDPAKVQGHLAAASYFQSVATPQNKEFVKRFRDKYGKDRAITASMEAAYFQVYLWKQAVQKAKSTDPDKVLEAIRGQEVDAPGGKVKLDEINNHTWKRFRIGKITKDRQLNIVFESKEWIPPDPYPELLNQ